MKIKNFTQSELAISDNLSFHFEIPVSIFLYTPRVSLPALINRPFTYPVVIRSSIETGKSFALIFFFGQLHLCGSHKGFLIIVLVSSQPRRRTFQIIMPRAFKLWLYTEKSYSWKKSLVAPQSNSPWYVWLYPSNLKPLRIRQYTVITHFTQKPRKRL